MIHPRMVRFASVFGALLVACAGAPAAKEPVAPARIVESAVVAPEGAGGGRGSGVQGGIAFEESGPVPISSRDPQLGNRDALVTMVVFSDLQCPFCARHDETVLKLRAKYREDQLRIVWKHYPLPFHAMARPAALVADEVFRLKGSAAFFQFVSETFREQNRAEAIRPTLFGANPENGPAVQERPALDNESLVARAQRFGVDPTRARAALGATGENNVDAGIALANRLKVRGTPATVINGEALSGAQKIESFTRMIDARLADADAMLQKGMPRQAVIEKITLAQIKFEKDEAEEEKVDDNLIHKVPVGNSPVLGPADAPITVVVFSDFECPFCAKAEGTLTALMREFPGQVRLVWKDSPLAFHEQAVPAAVIARLVREKKGDVGFWDAHDKLFALPRPLTAESVRAAGAALGVSAKALEAGMKQDRIMDAIDDDLGLGDGFGASATPTFFINGRRVTGAKDAEVFRAIFKEEYAKARALRDAGTSPDRVYDALVEKGIAQPGVKFEKKDLALPLSKDNPVRGAATAKVTLQVFSDFQCPFCKRLEPTLARLQKRYPTQLRIVWRDNPLEFHKQALPAAIVAREAFSQKGNVGFWKVHDLVFDNQKDLSEEKLVEFAKLAGLNVDSVRKALADKRHEKVINADAALAKSAGISGTPGTMVNNYFLSGSQPYFKFRRVVEQALKEARP
jgi:protein-disulfide isomerase